MSLQTTKTHIVHGGTLRYLKHDSAATGTPMTLSVFVPGGEGPFAVLIWLSGLTCTEDNFTTKAGAYRAAAEHGLIIVAPDTSPPARAAPILREEASPTTQPMTWARGRASTSMRRKSPGRRISAWKPMSRTN